MNFANQLIHKIQTRFQNESSCDSLENLNEEQLTCRKRKIKSVYSVLGMSFLIALITNFFALITDDSVKDDKLLIFIFFAVLVVTLFIVLFKEFRKKMDKIDEHLNNSH